MTTEAAVIAPPRTATVGYWTGFAIVLGLLIIAPLVLPEFWRRFATEISILIGSDRDIPAPDVNTDGQVMAWIMDTLSMHLGYSAPASVILRSFARLKTWNPPESVRIAPSQPMKRCSPPSSFTRP